MRRLRDLACRRFAALGVAAMASFALCAASAQPEDPPPAPVARPTVQNAKVPDWAPRVPFTPIPHVEVMGNGPVPVLLIPGIAQDWTVFKSFGMRNSARYTTYAVTLPGFGGTEPAPLPENSHFKDLPVLRNAIEALLRLVEERHLDRPVIGGYELGAHLAMWLAMDHPELFRAIINLEGDALVPVNTGNPDYDPEEREKVIQSRIFTPMKNITEEAWKASLAARALNLVSDPDRGAEIGRMLTTPSRGVTLEYTFEYYMSDISPGLSDLKVPMLMIPAVHSIGMDRALQPELTRQRWRNTYAKAARTTLVFFEDSYPYVLDEAPEKLDRVIEDFLAGRTIERALVSATGSGIPPEGLLAPAPARP